TCISNSRRSGTALATLLLTATGTPIAIASKIFVWTPRATRRGPTAAEDPRRYGRISGTAPVTQTAGSHANRRTARVGFLPAITKRARGSLARTDLKTSR